MVQLINWQSLGAFGTVLVVLVLLIRWIVIQFIKSMEKREDALIMREEKLLAILQKTNEAISLHTRAMQEFQQHLEGLSRQIKKSEANLKRTIKYHAN